MYLAAENGHLEIIKSLKCAGALIDDKNNINNSPIHISASNGHLNVI
jgi:ankyrin repeat protein